MSRCHGDVCSMFAHMSRCLCQDGIPPSGFSLFTVSQSTIHWTLNTFCSCCCPSADPEDPLRVTDQTRPMGLVVCRGTSVMLVSASCLLSWGELAMQLARHRRHAGKAFTLCLVCDVGRVMVCLIRRSLTPAPSCLLPPARWCRRQGRRRLQTRLLRKAWRHEARVATTPPAAAAPLRSHI